MKTAIEILSELSGIPKYRLTADDEGEYITKSGALQAMEEYASQRESKYRELYEAREELHKLRDYLFPLNEPFENYLGEKRKNRAIELRQKISSLESELNLDTK